MDLVSVIVPVYNVQNFLVKCLDSIIGQTWSNLEIILVDDGSTDGSGKICDEYLEKYECVKVVHQKNGGLSAARNTGLDICTGEWVTFIDSDDYVSDDFIECLYKVAKEYQAEVAMCLNKKFFDGDIVEKDMMPDKTRIKVYNSVEAIENMLYRKNITAYACGKLFKRELFENIRFPEKKLFEDLWTTYKVYYKTKKVVFIPVENYYYYQRSQSIVNSGFNAKKMDQVYASEEIMNFAAENCPEICNAAASKCFVSAADIYRRIPRNGKFDDEQEYVEAVIRKYRKMVFMDNNNKLLTRVMAFCSMMGIKTLYYGATLYQWMVAHKLIKLKNPV